MVKGKKIFFSTYDDRWNPWYGGGGAISIHEVAKRLSLRHSVTVICGKYPGCRTSEHIDGVMYRRIGVSWFGSRFGQVIFWLLLPLYGLFARFDVWFDNFTPPFGVSLLPVLRRKSVVGLVHMLPGEDMWRKYKIPFFLVERWGLRWYRSFVVPTEHMENLIRRANRGARIRRIPNGVDLPLDPFGGVKEHILFVGRFEIDQKGLDLLVQSYGLSDLAQRYPLVIAGGGNKDEMEKLKQLIAKQPAHIAERIRLVGRVDGARKEAVFSKAVVVAVPSRFETFSMVALEALAYGAPVVLFEIPSLRWLPETCVYRAKCFDAPDFGRKMAQAVEQRKEDSFYRAVAQSYSWDKISGAYEKMVWKVLHG